MSSYSARYSKPLGAGQYGMGGAATDLGIEALAGETEMITVFDDFNDPLPNTEFGAVSAADGTTNAWEECGWVMTDVGTPTGDEVGMNDPGDVDVWTPSCIRIMTATTEDEGGNMQLDLINSTADGTYLGSGTNDMTFYRRNFPHLWFPETAAGVTAPDNTVWTFGCRIGLRADFTNGGLGDWDSKLYIGYAVAGEAAVMTPGTGAISVAAAADQLVGFHVGEDGSLDGISQRVGTTAYAEGTNFTELLAAGGVDGTVANGAATAGDIMWFDLAFRMTVLDSSETTGNGATRFYHRRVPKPGDGYKPWVEHPTVLIDQTPSHTVSLVPTIEAINGPTAGRDGMVYLDSWAFGVSRYSLLNR